MQGREDNPHSNEQTKKQYAESREMIQTLFSQTRTGLESEKKAERPAKIGKVSKAIQEFYKVQREFHAKMARLVSAISANPPPSYQDNLALLDEILKPYRILANNPFNQEPTGDDLEDLHHIVQVINLRNQQFQSAFNALIDGVARASSTNAILTECKSDVELTARIKDTLGVDSWMIVQGHADQPFQNLTRYMLLLKTIREELLDDGYKEIEGIDGVLDNLGRALGELSPQVRIINDNLENIFMLNNMERIFKRLLLLPLVQAEKSAKEYEYEQWKKGQKKAVELKPPQASESSTQVVDSEQKSDPKKTATEDWHSFEKPLTVYARIQFVLDCAHTGKKRILFGDQDLQILFTNLLTFMREISSANEALELLAYKSSSYLYQFGSAAYGILFSPSESAGGLLSPQTEFKQLIHEVEKMVEKMEQVEVLRNLEARHRQQAAAALTGASHPK